MIPTNLIYKYLELGVLYIKHHYRCGLFLPKQMEKPHIVLSAIDTRRTLIITDNPEAWKNWEQKPAYIVSREEFSLSNPDQRYPIIVCDGLPDFFIACELVKCFSRLIIVSDEQDFENIEAMYFTLTMLGYSGKYIDFIREFIQDGRLADVDRFLSYGFSMNKEDYEQIEGRVQYIFCPGNGVLDKLDNLKQLLSHLHGQKSVIYCKNETQKELINEYLRVREAKNFYVTCQSSDRKAFNVIWFEEPDDKDLYQRFTSAARKPHSMVYHLLFNDEEPKPLIDSPNLFFRAIPSHYLNTEKNK